MKKWYGLTILILALCLALLACGEPGPASTSPAAPAAPSEPAKPATPVPSGPRYGGSLKIIEAVAPGSPIGVIWETTSANACQQLCLEPLFKAQADGTLDPLVAISYENDVNPDAPSTTFHLTKGVKFHDGTDFNAQALKWNFEHERDSAQGRGGTRYWKSFEVIDDYTLKINLTQYRNSLIPFYATNSCYMISPTAFEKNDIDWMRWNMVGTGPFIQTEFQRDVSFTAKRNSNYYMPGKPYLDEVKYLFVADEMTRVASFRSGGADVLNCAGSGRVASEFQALGRKLVSQLTGASVLMPDGKNENSPWSNLKVRMAAEYAIDKESIAKSFGYGFWEAAYQLPSPENMAHIPNLVGRKYDPEKAKQLLTEAGYPNGFQTKLISPNTVNRDVVVAIQSNLGQVGIKIDLDFPEPAKYITHVRDTWEDALLFAQVGENANYNVTFGYMMNIPQATYKSLKQPDNWPELYNAVMVTPEVEAKLQQKAIQGMVDDVTLIPIVYTSDIMVVSDKLHDAGFGTRERGGFNPEDAWLSE